MPPDPPRPAGLVKILARAQVNSAVAQIGFAIEHAELLHENLGPILLAHIGAERLGELLEPLRAALLPLDDYVTTNP